MNVKPTTERLADALREVSAPPGMIEKALAGVYDEWKSDLPFPLIQLAMDAKQAGLGPTFHQRIINSEFDASKEEGDAWTKSLDGQATFAEFFSSLQKRPASHRQQNKQRKKCH